MWVAVVPAKNEQGRIRRVLQTLSRLPFDLIIPVINGSTDETLNDALDARLNQVHILYFSESLGIDVPRAVGALYAQNIAATGVVFVDGDMTGDIGPTLEQLMATVDQGVDLALTNCYPYITNRESLANEVLKYRGRLNRELGLFSALGLASPSHGPHAVSAGLLAAVPVQELCVPPVMLALARQAGLNIKVAAAIPHRRLGSKTRDGEHARQIAHTIIGDCLEAIHVYRGLPRSRTTKKKTFIGYDSSRRRDILEEFILRTANAIP
ncbi:MAG: glycosyltransferase [Heliobacteriaceae bacterium]|nr:glycosyltransferase [Heliobacteriaceae bacterium]MDD4587627.1 glycosyltransferase [Heliobacteriaceae bacterium]